MMVNKIMIFTPGSTLVISSPVYAQSHIPQEQNPDSPAPEPERQTGAVCFANQLDECSNEALLALNGLIAAEIEKRGLNHPSQTSPEPTRPVRRRRKRQELPDL